MSRVAGSVYDDIAHKKLDDLRDDISERNVELKKKFIDTRGVA